MELGFFEFDDDETTPKSQEEVCQWKSDDDDEGEDETKAFWESQHQLLQEALCRRSSTETRIKRDTEEAIRKMQSVAAADDGGGSICSCLKECRQNYCLLRNISGRLCDAGYDSAICKSKWRRSPEIPSGEHNYIDVVVEPKNGKKSPIKIIVELNFRAEFEMARANSEYNRLVSNLPEIFVGKSEKMRSVIRVMCGAAKKCMKENKMHMAPWRKYKYMQAKWLGTCERVMPSLSLAAVDRERPTRPRASMLTFDLHCTAVEVI